MHGFPETLGCQDVVNLSWNAVRSDVGVVVMCLFLEEGVGEDEVL